jgi:CDGSH-type Zn-finger protein
VKKMAGKIVVSKNGPYLVSGELEVDGSDGKKIAENKPCALCRCGQSKKKPFCDGTHISVGWKE